jgi:predicted small secreted protein
MKKSILKLTAIVLVASLTSCATVFGGAVSDCQRTKPAAGEPARKVRVGALIANILLFTPGIIIDFATGAIYQPCDKK